jgi:hypothetical protein
MDQSLPVRSARVALLTCLLLCAPACHTGSANTALGAGIMTTLAVGASAAKRSSGDCYVDCLPGTRCNRQSGLCETLPCRDKCGPNESCEESLGGIKCIPAKGLSVSATKGEEATATGAVQEGRPIEKGQTAAPSSALTGGRAPQVKDEGGRGQGPAVPERPFKTDPSAPDPAPAMDNPSLPPPK